MSAPQSISTACDLRFAIGIDCDIVRVGDSIDRQFGWDKRAIDPTTLLEVCGWEPVNFTGYTPQAFVLDANGNTLATFAVTPSPGDPTGTFTFVLSQAQVTESLKANAVRWTFTVTAGDVKHTLIYVPFKIT